MISLFRLEQILQLFFLKVNNGKTPIVAISVSDPIKSKFVLNEQDSGIDNFTVRIVPNQFKRMFEIFHDRAGFKKLGIDDWDTENGKKYTNLDDAHLVAKERGFEIIEYNKVMNQERGRLSQGSGTVSAKIDAFFILALNCLTGKQVMVMSAGFSEREKNPQFCQKWNKRCQGRRADGIFHG
ncbi:MAG: hypothetical protein R2941_07225 [Desulfobacterales bacterium]